jgi:hypothetical protein
MSSHNSVRQGCEATGSPSKGKSDLYRILRLLGEEGFGVFWGVFV